LNLQNNAETVTNLDMTAGGVTTGTGTLTLNNGTLSSTSNVAIASRVSTFTSKITGNVALPNGGSLRIAHSSTDGVHDDLELNGTITGSAFSVDTPLPETLGGGATVLAGTLKLSGTASNSYSGNTVINAGTVKLGKSNGIDAIPAGGLTINNGATVQLVALNQINDAAPVSLSGSTATLDLNNRNDTIGSVAMSSGLIKTGSGILTVASGGGITASANATQAEIRGKLSLAGTSTNVSVASAANLLVSADVSGSASMNISGGGPITLTGANTFPSLALNAGVLKIDDLSALGSGKTDLTTRGMIVTADTRANVEARVKIGRASGNWTGTGITSSTAAANGAQTTAVGVAVAGEAGYTSFLGQTVSSTDVLVKYTYAGDSNLDGKVTFDDFQNFLGGFGAPSGGRWFNGDFNYSGQVTFDDFQIFLDGFSAYNSSRVTLAPPDEALQASFAAEPLIANTTAPAPEPSCATLALAGGALLGRRRRRS
jgi:autotransporter-associated beta strand protein